MFIVPSTAITSAVGWDRLRFKKVSSERNYHKVNMLLLGSTVT